MSHSLRPTRRLARPPSRTRVALYWFSGDWSGADELRMQRAMDAGVTSQVEMCRDGLWFTGPPGPELRELCADLARRGLRRGGAQSGPRFETRGVRRGQI